MDFEFSPPTQRVFLPGERAAQGLYLPSGLPITGIGFLATQHVGQQVLSTIPFGYFQSSLPLHNCPFIRPEE